ncbi:hypothetical protein SSS_07045, partial [Sarcoptes scabiei]
DFLFAIANKFNLVSTTKLVMNFTNLIGFIGAGNIAQSLAKGFIRSGKIEPNQIYAAAPSNRNLPRFKELGCNVTNDNAQILSQFFEIKSRSVDRINFFLFVCVKPQIIAERKKDFWNFLLPLNQKLIEIQEDFFIVSVMAGWKLSSLRDQIESHLDLPRLKWLKFARALPNIACSLNNSSRRSIRCHLWSDIKWYRIRFLYHSSHGGWRCVSRITP